MGLWSLLHAEARSLRQRDTTNNCCWNCRGARLCIKATAECLARIQFMMTCVNTLNFMETHELGL